MNQNRRLVVAFRILCVTCLAAAAVASDGAEAAVTPSTVYVSRILEGMVAVIDANTDQLIAFVRTGSNPAEIGVVASLSRAFVADLTDSTVTVIETTGHGIDDTITLASPPATIGVDEAAQRVFALDFSNGAWGTDLHVIDADSKSEIDTFMVGTRTQNIAVSAADDVAYVTDFEDGIIEVDTGTGAVLRTLAMSSLPHGIALNESTDRLYVTRLDADDVKIIDTAATDLTVIGTVAVGEMPQWIALDLPRGKALVTNEGDDTVSVFDLATHNVHPAAIPVGDGPLTLTIHDGAARAYVYNANDGTISVIDTVSETVVATIDVLFGDGFELGNTAPWSSRVP
ncbi:MAG: YncE family protein [Acidobacteria bacterium]|jgi:YVTN family beta-propeller protein|nr:YncE family protein [Acidobacteriota bacterium]